MAIMWIGLGLAACAPNPVDIAPWPAVPEEAPTENELRAGCLSTSVSTWEGARPLPAGSTMEERYDDHGWLIRAAWWQDGGPDVTAAEWVRREDGQYDSWKLDFGDNDDPESTEVYGFGEDDLADTRDLDSQADGRIDEHSDYVNLDGRRVEERLDRFADGAVDAVLAYAWDDLGRPLEVARDDGLDGTIDSVATWDWLDETELLLTYDDGLEYREEHDYDDDLREIRSYVSQPFAGAQETLYVYDGDDRRPSAGVFTKRLGAELVEYATLTLDWDDDGRPIGVRYDYAPSESEPPDRAQIVTIEWLCPP